jgi:hypothetical protein
MTPTRPGSSAASGVGFAINLDPVPVLGLRVGIGVSGAGWMCVGSRRACGLHRRSLARRYSLRDGAWVSDLELPLAAHHLRGEDLKAVQASQPRGRGTTLLTHLGPPSHRRRTSASYARPQVCSDGPQLAISSTPPHASWRRALLVAGAATTRLPRRRSIPAGSLYSTWPICSPGAGFARDPAPRSV